MSASHIVWRGRCLRNVSLAAAAAVANRRALILGIRGRTGDVRAAVRQKPDVHCGRRWLSSTFDGDWRIVFDPQNASVYGKLPLNQAPPTSDKDPLPSLDVSSEVGPNADCKWKISTMASGLRVATRDSGGLLASMGLFVAGGTRAEDSSNLGASHVLEILGGFLPPSPLGGQQQLNDDPQALMQQLGAASYCCCSREGISYSVEALRHIIPLLTPSLIRNLDCTRSPVWKQAAKTAITAGIDEDPLMALGGGVDALVVELLHQVAWGGTALGTPRCAEEPEEVGIARLENYIARNFVPSKSVLVGLNVDHSEVCSAAQGAADFGLVDYSSTASQDEVAKHCGGGQAVVESPQPHVSCEPAVLPLPDSWWRRLTRWTRRSGDPLSSRPAISTYVGGSAYVPIDTCSTNHFAIAFEVRGGCSAEKAAMSSGVLQAILGGGGSFSAGGPGKGMKSRLYVNALAKNHWIESCNAFSIQYSDSGLFGLHFVGDARHAEDMIRIMCSQFRRSKTVTAEELARAKNVLKSTVLINLENRHVTMEETARQLLSRSSTNCQVRADVIQTAEELCDAIDAVTPEDIRKLVECMMNGQPTVIAVGDLSAALSFERVAALLGSDSP